MSENSLWETLGELEEEESQQVLIQLFTKYEELQRADGKNEEVARFFSYLDAIVTQVRSCNVNRR